MINIRIDMDYRERETDRHLALAKAAIKAGWESIVFKDLDLDLMLYNTEKLMGVEIKTVNDLWASVRKRLKGQYVRATTLDGSAILLILGGIDDIFSQGQLRKQGRHYGGGRKAAGMMREFLADTFSSGFYIAPLSTNYELSFEILLSSVAAWFEGRDLCRWSPKGLNPHRLFFETLPGIGQKTSQGLYDLGYRIQVIGPNGNPVTSDQLANTQVNGRCIGSKARKILELVQGEKLE